MVWLSEKWLHCTSCPSYNRPSTALTPTRSCDVSGCLHTLPYITYSLWNVTEHSEIDFDQPGWHTGQPNTEVTRVTYKLTQNTQQSTATAAPSSVSSTCRRSGRKRRNERGTAASSVSTSRMSLQHEDGGRGELEVDLRQKQGAERQREGKGGWGAAAHRTLW